MVKPLRLASVLLFVTAGCTVDVPEPGANTFACTDKVDCASGYGCNLDTGTCAKECSGPSDCSGATPICANGTCGDACAAMVTECFSKNQVCSLASGTAKCVPCDQNDKSCNSPSRACVIKSSSEFWCVPTCNTVSPTCDWPSGMARCVNVKDPTSSSGGYVPVCAPCPSTCTGGCFSAADNKSETYAGATTCTGGTEDLCGDGQDNDGDMLTDCADPDCSSKPVCGTCSGSGMCGLGKCVSSKCQPSCETAACSGNATCVLAKETPTLGGVKVCKPCSTSCDAGTTCSYTGSSPGSPADFDTIPVACMASWYDPASTSLGATGSGNFQLALAFDSSGQLYLAWTNGADNVVKVRYVDASGAWNEAVPSSSPTNGVSGKAAHDPAIAFEPSGNSPHVAWSQADAGGISHVYWSKPGGTLWTNYGVVGTPSSHNSNTGAGIDDDSASGNLNEAPAIGFVSGVPVIVWQHKQVTAYEVHGRFYEPSTDHWLTLGKHGASFGVVSDGTMATTLETHPSVAASTSTLYVAWVGVNAGHNTAMVRGLPTPSVGSTWVAGDSYVPLDSDLSIGAPGVNLDTALAPAMATDASDYPLLAFHGAQSSAGDRQLFVLKSSNCTTQADCSWDGYAGGTQPAVSVTGKNLTNVSMSYFPGASGPGARPFIAYLQEASIRVKHYTGQWEGLDGSDADPGLSGSDNASSPKLAIYTAADQSGVVCVAWASGVTDEAVRVRCHHVM